MDFTEIYKHTTSLVSFSPGAHFILTAVQDRVIVRRTDTFQITRTWQIDPSPSPTHAALLSKSNTTKQKQQPQSSVHVPADACVTHLGWSRDSEYILAACARRAVVHLYKLRDETWSGRIDCGVEGLVKAEWAPDGRSVLCFSEWGLRTSLWSLVTGAATYIQYPIHPDRGYGFRSDGRYFVLAERHKSKETIGVYDASDSYKLVRHFPLSTSSMGSLSISPNGNYLAIWEGSFEYKLYIVTLAGTAVATFSPEPDPGFGIRCVSWSPNGMMLAVGGWDDKVYIIDNLSWSAVATLELSSKVPASTNVWREPSKWLEATEGRGFLSYERLQGTQSIPVLRADHTKAYPKSGVVQLEWNMTGSMLLVRFENAPNAVHIFEFPSPKERFMPKLRTLLLHSQPVLHAHWNPVRKGNLALCTGAQSVYVWSDEWIGEGGKEEEIAECIGVPAHKFETRDIKWAPDGKGFIIIGKEQFCCAFEVQEEAEIS